MPQVRRQALNESVFREVNERIAGLTRAYELDQIEIVCECAEIGCAFPLLITLKGYEAARNEATIFIVAPGHYDPKVEQVAAEEDGYLLIRKLGEAGDVARVTDPRGR